MGLLVGSPNLLQTAFPPLRFSFSSSSSEPRLPSPLLPLPLASRSRSAKKARSAFAVCCANEGSRMDASAASSRRALLLVGISVLPFLKLRAIAAEGLVVGDKDGTIVPERQDVLMPDKQELIVYDDIKQDTVLEVSSKGANQFEVADLNPPANSSASFLNEFGIIASGVLGALYATSQKEKKDIESTVESMKGKLTGKEAAMNLLKENFEKMLKREEEEKKNQMRKFKEDEDSLLNQLALANKTTAALRQEIQSERKLVEELEARIGHLEISVTETEAEKKILEAKFKEKTDNFDALQDKANLLILEINDKGKNLESLKSLLSENELEFKKLNSIMEHLKEELVVANLTIEKLKEELHAAKVELSSKISSIDSLNNKIQFLSSEKDSYAQKFQDLMKDYNDLKSSSDRRAALDAELISKKDNQLQDLEGKLELALAEARNNNAVINELRKEKDDIKALLEREESLKKSLGVEIKSTLEALASSKFEASCLSKELDETKASYEKLMSEITEIQDGFSKSEKMLTSSLEEAKSSAKLLSDELVSVKEDLRRAKEEFDITSIEFKNVMEDRKKLKMELVEVYTKLQVAVDEVNEERTIVSTLNKELEVLREQAQKESEARRALEADLHEATKSLDEMNNSALLLSSEVESSNFRTANLEAEKEMLLQSLTEQKNLTKEAREDIEDSQNLIMRLGSERENLETRSKKLEEELTSAKGEILRLRRQISMKQEPGNDLKPKTKDVTAGTPFTVRKTTSRRKRNGSAREAS